MTRHHLRVGSLEWNRAQWGNDTVWRRGGNSWTFHAESSGQSYEAWKTTLLREFLEPYLGSEVDFIEIGPGYGRWTEFIVGRTRSLTVIDLNANCIEVCRERFGAEAGIACVVNDGRSIDLPSASVDVVWSFGSFVHFDPAEVDGYLAECGRVLRRNGRFVIHHAGWKEWSLKAVPVTRHLGRPGRVVQHRLGQGRWRPGGDRAAMSPKWFVSLATRHGLLIDRQVRTWGPESQFGLAFHDVISIGTRS